MKPWQKRYIVNYFFSLVICCTTVLTDHVRSYPKFIIAALIFSFLLALIFTVSETLFLRWSGNIAYQMKYGKKKQKE